MKKTVIFTMLTMSVLLMMSCGSTDSTSEDSIVLSSEIAEEPQSVSDKMQSVSDEIVYEIGDIIFADGSVIKSSDLTMVDSGNLPVAIIAGFDEDGTAFGLGVHRSDTPLPWAADDSAGYATRFTDIICTQNAAFDFSGDTDGSDNWDMICTRDNEDTADAQVNYPAFYFVSTYAEHYRLSGDFVSGWYMPSIAELCSIYQNRERINRSLERIGELNEDAAMDGLGTTWYWSSSQAGSEDDYAWFVHYFNGYAGECPKNFTNVHVLAVRRFL